MEFVGEKTHGHYDSFGPIFNTTNNRMEYQAAIEALKFYGPLEKKVEIRTDSQLLVNTCSLWMWSWEAKEWRKKIKNLDLVKELFILTNKYNPTFTWVKGHNNNYHNDLADELANEACARFVE